MKIKHVLKWISICTLWATLSMVSHAQEKSITDQVMNWFGGDDQATDVLDLNDQQDFESAQRGFIGSLDPAIIKDENGKVVFNAEAFSFLSDPAPSTVNASFWRQSQLVAKHGLFKVTEGIYQVRGYDLANITFIEGKTGWIVVDPLLSKETAAAAKSLVDQHLGTRPITGVVLTHSHADHYAGIRGIISEDDLAKGVPLVAPAHFTEESISENVLAGNAMSRRASYMFGSLLPTAASGNVGVGLGPALSSGALGMLAPTVDVTETGQTLEIDGVQMNFILALGAEAPSEFMFYLPQFKAFCQAEIINHTLHNMLTPRGAKVRNGKIWSEYIDEAIVAYGDITEVSFGSHHWPTWGSEAINEFWEGQRDLYRFIHDQTLRLANEGYTINEIPSQLKLPAGLARQFANRSYYGDIGFNARSQYQLYFGFFDGNPVNLNPLPNQEEALKYIDYMGGGAAVIQRVKVDIENKEYQFAATVLNHLVFAEPSNAEAKSLLVEVYQQMAALSENGPHRNFYLTAALELTQGVAKRQSIRAAGTDTVRAIPLDMYFDLLAVRFNGTKAGDKKWAFNFNVTSTKDGKEQVEKALLIVSNGVLHSRIGVNSEDANATLTISRSGLDALNLDQAGILRLVVTGEASVGGNPLALQQFFSLVEDPDRGFNIVTP